jgi:hypothetical protein
MDDNAEDQINYDNLSDMVSANVSGRGTPNVSGKLRVSAGYPTIPQTRREGGHFPGVRKLVDTVKLRLAFKQ